MFKVTAVANGYYGQKVRVPGEVFGITDVEHFSVEWMDSDEPKVLAFVREQAKLKGNVERGMTGFETARENAISERGKRHAEWLDARKKGGAPATDETRRVNTGGTDGVVGIELPAQGAKLSAKERIALAKSISGREDNLTAAEADAIIAAAQASGGSANDDRARDQAVDPNDNAPAPAATDPLDHDGNGKKGGAKKADDDEI